MSLRDELGSSATKEFWEVSERGSNFTYLEPHLREQLSTFYEWFTAARLTAADEWTQYMNSDGAFLSVFFHVNREQIQRASSSKSANNLKTLK